MNDKQLQIDTPPNRLTMLRIVAVPLVVGCMYFDMFLFDCLAAFFFSIAAITDFFDGYLARRTQSVTVFGKLMDPLADKFLVVSTLIMLLAVDRVAAWVVILLICREMAISSIRAMAAAEGVVIAAKSGGKWKAAVQMTALPFLMVKVNFFDTVSSLWIGTALLYLSLLLSLYSLYDYGIDFVRILKSRAADRSQQP